MFRTLFKRRTDSKMCKECEEVSDKVYVRLHPLTGRHVKMCTVCYDEAHQERINFVINK